MSDKSLDGAYALETPDDSRKLYRDWAETYDTGFAASHGYAVHRHVARVFHEQGGDGPVLDIGAGTGLVAEALGDLEIDAIDISQEMLDIAGTKGLYRRRYCADLTAPLDISDQTYQGFVSAGTFTHGHVGPACLSELLRIARPGALFTVSIKTEVYDGEGFGSAFAKLVALGQITPLDFRHVRFYEEGAQHKHADDTGLVAFFRKS
ncbi:MAG: class I SAM-dependent methyltransferase [Pseudomonadota bacterium]